MRPAARSIAVAGLTAGLTAGLALLPALSYAQTPAADVAYCRTLSQIYVRYIGHDFQWGEYARLRANNDAQVASTKCESDPAFAIPVLERELVNNKFTLPPRG